MADDIDPKTDVYLIPATKGNKTIIKIFINNKWNFMGALIMDYLVYTAAWILEGHYIQQSWQQNFSRSYQGEKW